MKVAALDLGTNTFLCLIAEVEGSRVVGVYDDQVRVVRLGQDVNRTRAFHPDALSRARLALTEFSEIISRHQPARVLAMATSAARDVGNSAELFSIAQDLGIPIQIIPGAREAEITFRGAVSGFEDSKRRLVIDVGGGSTELTVGEGPLYRAGHSLDLGCVRLTEQYELRSPVDPAKFAAVEAFVREQMSHVVRTLIAFGGGIDELLAVAGTPTELARIEIGEFLPDKIDGFTLTRTKLEDWVEKFKTHHRDELTLVLGVHPGRADVILVGTLILLEALRASGLSEMKVSTRGVRYGIALDIAGG